MGNKAVGYEWNRRKLRPRERPTKEAPEVQGTIMSQSHLLVAYVHVGNSHTREIKVRIPLSVCLRDYCSRQPLFFLFGFAKSFILFVFLFCFVCVVFSWLIGWFFKTGILCGDLTVLEFTL